MGEKKRIGRVKDRTGERCGRLVAIKEVTKKENQVRWLCQCDCGNEVVVAGGSLTSGNTRSCGCLNTEKRIMLCKKRATHNLTHSIEYDIWAGLKTRCYNPRSQAYRYYGGKGVFICRRWRNSFENFYKDMGLRPSTKHSIDRIDSNGPYAPWNCRWATPKEQSNNRDCIHYLYYGGEKKSITEWAKIYNIRYKTLFSRINQYGWDTERALTTHPDLYHSKGVYEKNKKI